MKKANFLFYFLSFLSAKLYTSRNLKKKVSITIGTRQNNYKYFSNPRRFTELEIEVTKNFLTQPK